MGKVTTINHVTLIVHQLETTMKTWYSLLIILVVVSCQTKTANTESIDVINTPLELLRFGNDNTGKHVVLISGDEEYRSEEALPQLAKILSTHHGFRCTVLFAQDPSEPGIVNPNFTGNIPGLAALDDADLMILFTRFRALPNDQMEHFENYLMTGKPLIGIRTATHAFNFIDTTNVWAQWGNYNVDEGSPWNGGFGRLVLGERWHAHHGHHRHQSTRGLIAEEAVAHPIVNGIADGEIWGPTDVYGVRLPLPGDIQRLILGQVVNRAGEYDEADPFYGLKPTDNEVATINPASDNPYNPNDPMMPIAWIKTYEIPGGKPGKAFTSTIGSSTDMTNDGVRRLLVNAAYYLLDQPVPDKSKVNLVGSFEPSAYKSYDLEYWEQKNLKIADLQ